MKKPLVLVLTIAIAIALISGCAAPVAQGDGAQQYTATYLDLFDTVTTVIGRDVTEEAFREKTQKIYDDLLYYHRLFDIYHDYAGVNNLKTVNDNAGVAPVKVDPAIIDLLLDCREYYDLTGGKVNVMMGSVLQLWHEARNAGINDPAGAELPAMEALQEAAKHCILDALQIDEEASTVYISDTRARLDVGAIAKGWATQRAAENAPKGMLISVGGNVCATGPKLSDGTPWVIGIQDPDVAGENLHTVFLKKDSVVTSGDYQRTYTVNGKAYHHIIDPNTLMPSTYWRSVSIVCADSGLADALSTALFLMDEVIGRELAGKCGAEVLWVAADGTEYMTDGFREILRT